MALSYEERRLETPLPFSGANVVGTDTTPLATRILSDTGFDKFAPDFARALCADGKTTITTYDQAIDVVKAQGAALWKAAVDRVQGRRASPAGSKLPNSEDRMLYWARVQMTKVLRQWVPNFPMTTQQREELQWQLERSSRGQLDIAFPENNTPDGRKYRRMIASGFDVFTLGPPGTPTRGLRNGNPSAAVALEMDGREVTLSDGSVMRVETYILPVSYDPFHKGMQEDTLGPFFKPGPQRVDASITISQGRPNLFALEEFNGRFHGPAAGNDGIVYCPSEETERAPSTLVPIGTITTPGAGPITLAGSGCNIRVPERWIGYDNHRAAWMKDFPPQFSRATLPMAGMVTGKSQAGVVRPVGATSQGTEGFDVTWNNAHAVFPDCAKTDVVEVPWHGVVNTMPRLTDVVPPKPTACARDGSGGDYLSNESAYRNTVLRDSFKLSIPAGHIHVPVMNLYNMPRVNNLPRDDNAITDARYESYRTAIVAQTKALLTLVGNSSLVFRD